MRPAVATTFHTHHAEGEEWPRLVQDLPNASRRALDTRWLDPTQGTKLGSERDHATPAQGRIGSQLYGDPTQGTTIGSHPYDDPTQGRRIVSVPYEDPTQGSKIGSDPSEDPTRGSLAVVELDRRRLRPR